MKNYRFPCIFLFFATFNYWLVAQPEYPLFQCSGIIEESQSNPNANPTSCNTNFSNFIANHALELVPVNSPHKLKININVIFVQNAAGVGNFQVGNPQHMAHYNAAIEVANLKLDILQDNSKNNGDCVCNSQPDFYPSAYIELVPHYIEVQSDYYFDHMNDPVVNGVGSIFNTSRPFLKEIVELAKLRPNYAPGGINCVITNHGAAIIDLLNSPPGVAHWQIPSLTEPFSGYVIADLPSYDLEKDMIIHFPDGFLRYLGFVNFYAPNNEWWINGQWIPSMGQLLAHEVLHFLDLPDINGITNCPENIMNNSGSNDPTLKVNLTGCQLRRVFQAFYTKTSRTAIVCEDALESDIIVAQNETWSNNLRILGDIIVRSGHTLTITCEVHMGPNSRIIVERGGRLVLDGGLITGDCPGRWGVIRVEGDVPGQQAQSGKVVLKNGAVIEHARDAISMNPYHLPWDNGGLQNYYGGIVEAENSTIRNCVRAVEFMRYGQGGIKDKSKFNNVIFENLHEGVTIWADDGVTFNNCTFKNISKRGILSYDCEAVVRKSNTFEQQPIGVDVITTYPIVFASKIGRKGLGSNTFNCQDIGINIKSAGNVEPLQVFNNIFSGGNRGLHQNGNGLLYIENNRFSGHLTSVELHSGGTSFNHVIENEIQSSYLGAHSVKQNSGLRYQNNCFSANQLVDIVVSDGDVFLAQGEYDGVAAGNCFTKNGKPEIDNNTGTGPIFYYIKTGTPTTSCKYPVNLKNVILLATANIDNPLACGPSGLIGSEDEYYCDFDESLSIASLQQQRLLMLQELAALSSGSSVVAVKTLERCIKILESLIGQKMLDPESEDPGAGKENAIAFYTSAGMDFKDRTTAYGIMVHYGELSRARTFLNNFAPQTREESDFVAVQHINLDYLSDTRHYVLGETTKNYLYSVGTLDRPLDGYARSLYEVLTGERIEVEIPEVGTEERSEVLSSAAALLFMLVYPNPSGNGIFNLSVEGLPQGAVHSATLTDAFGRLVYSVNVSSDGVYGIGSERLLPGLYFLTVRDGFGYTLFSSKLLVSN